MTRYYIGVDWADREHQLYVGDETGGTVSTEMTVQELPEAMAQLGRWLDGVGPREPNCGPPLRSHTGASWIACWITVS